MQIENMSSQNDEGLREGVGPIHQSQHWTKSVYIFLTSQKMFDIVVVTRYLDVGNQVKLDFRTSKIRISSIQILKKSGYQVSGYRSICRHDSISGQKNVRILKHPDIKGLGR